MQHCITLGCSYLSRSQNSQSEQSFLDKIYISLDVNIAQRENLFVQNNILAEVVKIWLYIHRLQLRMDYEPGIIRMWAGRRDLFLSYFELEIVQ